MSHRNPSRADWPWRNTLSASLRVSRRERGTVLLMVVGVLALLAIIGVVYATIGKADRNASTASLKHQRNDDQAGEFAGYLAKVIADGGLARYVERTGSGSVERVRGYTYPWTDSYQLSVNPNDYGSITGLPPLPNGTHSKFNPTGDNRELWAVTNISDPREPGDSYLASLEPEWLRLGPRPDDPSDLTKIRDWRHISNFASSGNFVNIANIRKSRGDFNARPGFGANQMSYGLTLFDPNSPTQAPFTVGTSVVPGSGGAPANYAVPAHWTNNQVGMFRPAVDTVHQPADYEYLLNQYADSDGDGMIDSRLFELTDIADMFHNANASGLARSIVPSRGRLRLFVAARCVDNSAKLNVNVHDDFVNGPYPPADFVGFTRDDAIVPGISPSDIDLRRVFTLTDINASISAPNPQGYEGLPIPSATAPDHLTSDYSKATPGTTQKYNGPASPIVGQAAYANLMQTRRTGVTLRPTDTVPTPGYTTDAAKRLKDYELFGEDPHSARFSESYGNTVAPTSLPTNQRLARAPFDMSDELDLASFFNVNDSETLSRLEVTLGGRAGAYPTFGPLRENRPRSLEMSGRDELAAAAMFDPGAATNALSHRQLLSIHNDIRHLLTTVSGSRPIKDSGIAPSDADNGRELQGASTDISHALKVIREFGQVPRTAAVIPQDYANAVRLIFKLYANALAPYTDSAQFPGLWMQSPTGPDQVYASGLVYGGNPELALRMAAHMTANLIDAFDRERAVGTGTPANRPAAPDRNEPTALVLQLVQAVGPNQTLSPEPAGTNRQTNNAYKGGVDLAGDSTAIPPIPPAIAPGRVAPMVSDLRSSTTHGEQTGKMTIFGIEAQPFLTEVGTFALYTDAPHHASTGAGAGADDDTVDTGGGIPPPPLMDPSRLHITIRMEPKLENADFIGEVVAFQFSNPFDQDVVLYDGSAAAVNQIDKVQFYIQYAGRYYSFATANSTGTTMGHSPNTVKLLAGKTQTFYAINPGTLEEMGKRLQHIDEANQQSVPTRRVLPAGGDYTTAVRDWINRQLGLPNGAMEGQLTQIYPTTLNPVDPVPVNWLGFQQHDMDLWGTEERFGTDPMMEHLESLENPASSARVGERRVAQLWRLMRSSATLRQGLPTDAAGVNNDPTNDLLADRLRDPSNPMQFPSGKLWDTRKVASGTSWYVGATTGGDEDSTDPSRVLDNTGYSAIIWAAVRRPTDRQLSTMNSTPGGTLDTSSRPVRGVLPPWCMEARSDNVPAWTFNPGGFGTSFSMNKVEVCNQTAIGDKSDFTAGANNRERDTTLKGLLAASNQPANREISKPCPQKTSNPVVLSHDMVPKSYTNVAVEFHSVGEDALGGGETGAATAGIPRSRNPALFSRSGDFLLPLAVGPWFDPSRNIANGPAWTNNEALLTEREQQWMTLSEALALACGYYSPADSKDPLYMFGVTVPAANPVPARPPCADRGHLVLDAFTPYFQPPAPAMEKQPLGGGVPFALSIIDQFRAAVGISSTPKGIGSAAPPEKQTREHAVGGGNNDLGRPQSWESISLRQGVVNVNTMPLTTMRTLPMLSPEFDLGIPAANQSSWLRKPGGYFGSSNPLEDGTASYDIAATIKAYRDLSREEYRTEGGVLPAPIDFRVTTATPFPRKARTQLAASPTADTLRREARGIKSLGELAAINLYPDPDRIDRNGMFRFADPDIVPDVFGAPGNRNAQRLSFHPQVVSSRSYNRTTTGVVDTTGQIPSGAAQIVPLGGPELSHSYQDKLAILNALTNTVSVRSDIFTVYFLIHGYAPEDLDVEDTQPLVPSLAKRYVMVVDRATVVATGDKPRILMFKEVPLP